MNKLKPWRYALMFIILAILWILFIELLIILQFLTVPGFPLFKKLGIYLLPPLLAVAIVYALRELFLHQQQRRQKLDQGAAKAAEEQRVREDDLWSNPDRNPALALPRVPAAEEEGRRTRKGIQCALERSGCHPGID